MVNKLLQRQLNRYLANGNELPAGLDELLASISAQYDAYDEDRRMLERIVDVSSAEMQQLHERLQADIERRKKTEHELLISQQRYQSFINNSHQGIWRIEFKEPILTTAPVDKQVELFYNGILSECNHEMASMYGVDTLENFLNTPFKEFFRVNRTNTELITLFINNNYQIERKETEETDYRGNSKTFINSLTGIIENEMLVRCWGIKVDITDWSNYRKKIEKSETHLKASQQIAKVGSWEVNIDINAKPRTYEFWLSEEAYKIYEIIPNETELTHEFLKGFLHPEDKEKFLEAIRHTIDTGEMLNIEHRIILKSGEEKIVLQRGQLQYNPVTGLPMKLVGALQDVTEDRMAEIALKKAEANLRNLLEHSDTAYTLLDVEGRIVSYNGLADEIAKIYGSGRFVVGSRYVDFMPKNRRAEVEQSLQNIIETKTGIEYEVNYQTAEIPENWLLVKINPIINDDDNLIGINVAATNITKRKKIERLLEESNERYIMATKATNDIVWDWDIENNKFYRSANYGTVFGYPTTDNNIYYDNWVSSIHPDDRDRVEKSVAEKINDPEATKWEDEYRYYRQNGEIAYISDKGYIIHDTNKKAVRIVGAMQDITEKYLAEMERKKLTDELIQRNKDLEQFAYIVSHNLRAPVANILGFVNMLKVDALEEQDQKEYINALSLSISKLDEVILDLNTILQVKRELNEMKEPVTFSELVDDITNSISNSIKNENVLIKTDFSQINQFTTLKTYLYSIFYNLISNSIKYRRPNERPVIEIRSTKQNNLLKLTFKDNGMGIDLHKKGKHVFGLYKRFHSQIEGKGMGLYMVKTQVETLGGKIDIRSEVNVGTEFIIEFTL
ncbi:MAG: PAS domain-containing protein [Bacteroidota bacterium]